MQVKDKLPNGIWGYMNGNSGGRNSFLIIEETAYLYEDNSIRVNSTKDVGNYGFMGENWFRLDFTGYNDKCK